MSGSISSYVDEIVGTFMRGESELFSRWLQRHLPRGGDGEYLALRPLDRDVDEVWERLAVTAADAGVAPATLARHITPIRSGVITGPMSAHYLGFIPVFERLSEHPDERLRPAGLQGLEWARSAAKRESDEERIEAVRGL